VKKVITLVLIMVLAMATTAFAGELTRGDAKVEFYYKVDRSMCGGSTTSTAVVTLLKNTLTVNAIKYVEGLLTFNLSSVTFTTYSPVNVALGNWDATFAGDDLYVRFSNNKGDFKANGGMWKLASSLTGVGAIATANLDLLGNPIQFNAYNTANDGTLNAWQASTSLNAAGVTVDVYGGFINNQTADTFDPFYGANMSVPGPMGGTIQGAFVKSGDVGYGVKMTGADLGPATLDVYYHNAGNVVVLPNQKDENIPQNENKAGFDVGSSVDFFGSDCNLTFGLDHDIAAVDTLWAFGAAFPQIGSMVSNVALGYNNDPKFSAKGTISPLDGLWVTPSYEMQPGTPGSDIFAAEAGYGTSVGGMDLSAGVHVTKAATTPLVMDWWQVYGVSANQAFGDMTATIAGLFRQAGTASTTRAYGAVSGPVAGLVNVGMQGLFKDDSGSQQLVGNVQATYPLGETTDLTAGVTYSGGFSPYAKVTKDISDSSTLSISYGQSQLAKQETSGHIDTAKPWAAIANTAASLVPKSILEIIFSMIF